MQLDSLSWFPGHMTKTRRMITAELGNVDAVCEILDARIPMSSRNPDVDELTAGKPRLIVLNRVDQADPELTKRWAAYFRSLGYAVIETDAKQGGGVKQFSSAVRSLLRDKIASYEAKGQVGRVLRVMVLGIPNVGKSTFINKVSGRKSAKAEDRPGVTRTKQWAAWFRAQGYAVLEVDARSGAGVKQFAPAVRALLADKLRAYEEKGQVGRVLRVMVLGIPIVGKSTFINKVSGRKTAKAEEDRKSTRLNSSH